jgi:hypothetical protein
VHAAFNDSMHEKEHNWRQTKRDIWRNEELTDSRETMTKERRQSAQIQKIPESRMRTIKTRWKQRMIHHGDADFTIWGGLYGVGPLALLWCQGSRRGYGVSCHIYHCHLVVVFISPCSSAYRIPILLCHFPPSSFFS